MTLILNGTDGISDVDGSAATPAVRGTDTNTGLFFPAADTIAFAEGGAEVARITNTGAWSFGASGTATGTNGQVLTSAGSAAAPAWQTPTVTAPAGTTGQVQINNAGAFGAVGSGTTGQVLTSQGTGAAPVFAPPPAGVMQLLQTVTASNSAEVDLTAFSSDFDNYYICFYDAMSAASTGNQLVARLRIGGVWQEGGSYQTAFTALRPNNGAYSQTFSATENKIPLTRGLYSDADDAAGRPCGGIRLYGVNSVGRRKGFLFESQYASATADGGVLVGSFGYGMWAGSGTGVVSGIRFLMSGSNLFTGTFRLYGIANY